MFQNLSPTVADSVMVGDTIHYVVPGSPFSGSSYTSNEFVIVTKTLKKDSIMAVNGVPTPFASIEGLYNSSKALVAKPFTNNTQYWWYLRPIGVTTSKSAITFTPGTTDTQRIWINKTPTGINELSFNDPSAIRTYPNPAVNQLSFDLNIAADNKATATVMDAAGRTVLVKELDNTNSKHDLDLSTISTGMYMLRVSVGDNVSIAKFNVQK
ncbi:MAG TPA: T9SS type A sorting domain-containing protein [Chitinophagaceae bacterium]|nr:T9SS type A sorting domain-containing protein [Chitinophagaceae bacterium]